MKTRLLTLLSILVIAANISYAQTAKTPVKKIATEVIDLTPIGIPAKMTVPKGVKALEGPYDNSIKGPGNFEISIENAEMDIAAQRTKTEKDDLTTFIKYVQKDANGFMYEAKLISREFVHFEYIVTVAGKSYRMYDTRSTPLTKEQVQPMYDAVKSITAK